MAVWSQNRQGALLHAFFSRPSSLKKHHEQRYRKMWLPGILFSLMKPVHTFAFNFCFPLDIKLRCKPSNLIGHLLFSRFPFLLDQGYPHLLLFSQPFISSIFSCYHIVLWCQGANLRNSCQMKKKKKKGKPKDLVSLGNRPRGGYYPISFSKFPGVFIS